MQKTTAVLWQTAICGGLPVGKRRDCVDIIHLFKDMHTREQILVLVSVVFIVVQVQLDLAMPDSMSEITALVQTQGSGITEILNADGKMLFCAFGSLLSAVVVGFFAVWIHTDTDDCEG